jgi:hypothetical protein
MEAQQLLHSGGRAASSAAAGAKRKIDDVTNNSNNSGMGLRPTPNKSTPFVQVPSSRPPRWNDVEVSTLTFLL